MLHALRTGLGIGRLLCLRALPLAGPQTPRTPPPLDPGADRAGAANQSLAPDEERDSFAAIVASCGSRRDAEDLVAELVNAA